MLIQKNINKLFNYKSISSLSLIGMGLFFIQQPTIAMLRNMLSSSSKTIQAVSSTLSNQLKQSNLNQPVKYFYGSNGRRAIFNTSSSTSTSATTTPSNNQSKETKYFYGSNGRTPLSNKSILSSTTTSKVSQNTSALHTSASAYSSTTTTKISDDSSNTGGNSNERSISNLVGEINKFRQGIQSVSDDYANLSKQIRAHIEKLQRKSKK